MATRIGGWWRLWIVVCVTYGVVVAAYFMSRMPTFEQIRFADDFANFYKMLAVTIVAWVVPCLIVLGFGFVVRWVLRGFRSRGTR